MAIFFSKGLQNHILASVCKQLKWKVCNWQKFAHENKKKHKSDGVVVQPLKAPDCGGCISTDCVIRCTCISHAKLPVKMSFIKTKIRKHCNKFRLSIYLYGKILS